MCLSFLHIQHYRPWCHQKKYKHFYIVARSLLFLPGLFYPFLLKLESQFGVQHSTAWDWVKKFKREGCLRWFVENASTYISEDDLSKLEYDIHLLLIKSFLSKWGIGLIWTSSNEDLPKGRACFF